MTNLTTTVMYRFKFNFLYQFYHTYLLQFQKAEQWLAERIPRLHVVTQLNEALKTADLFIEAVVENREVKQDLFAEVEELGPRGIVLVTNTSSMRLSDLGEKLQRPELLGGLHFFSPVPLMKPVEVRNLI